MHPIKHFKTVFRHRRAVIRHCKKTGILCQGLIHDLSKYSPKEFIPGAKYWQGTRSPNAKEREEQGYSSAWLHHKGRNRHHYEYWTDYIPEKRQIGPVKMPLKYTAEMLCDRMAASKIYKGKEYKDSDPLDYFLNGSAQYAMHPETAKALEKWLRILAEKGEDEAFREVRKDLKSERR